jgi:hypothetical protein
MFEPLPDFEERVRRLFMIRSTLQRSDTVKGRTTFLEIKCEEFALQEICQKSTALGTFELN